MQTLEAKNQIVKLPLFDQNGYSVFIKREDQLFPIASGNKWRKLRYNIETFKSLKCDCIITFGGAYSNHLAAAAALAKKQKIDIIGVVRGQELSAKTLNPTLLKCKSDGMDLVFVSRSEYSYKSSGETVQKLINSKKCYIIPEGGTNDLAVKGCMEILTKDDNIFDVIVCAVGTGGTLAGLANSAKKNQKIVGFQMVNDSAITERIRTFTLCDNWELIKHPSYKGYANLDESLLSFARYIKSKTGILLDPLYTGPMLYQLFQLINRNIWNFGKNILLIHTGGTQSIAGFNIKYQTKWPEN